MRPPARMPRAVMAPLTIFCLLLSSTALAAGPAGLSGQLMPLASVDALTTPAVDVDAVIAEDAVREAQGLAPRYAIPIAADVTLADAGTLESLKGAERVWRLRVRSEGASSLNFGFGRYVMPAGGSLYVYSADGSTVRGPFTDADNEVHGELWTPIVPGDEAVIEVRVPTDMLPFLELRLTSINHGYKDFWVGAADKSGSCNVDVVCPQSEGWRDQVRSVGVISTGGGTFCSGFLVNNVEEDLTPYFMTANHCEIDAGNAASLVVYWNYETSTCGGWPDGVLDQYQTGSIFRAARAASDFTLVELDDPPDPAFDVHWTGWDNSDADPTSATAIHHPSTDEKRISFEYDPLSTTSYYGTSVPGDGTHLRITDWDLGTTEPGSSGSGLWNQDHRIVGQLHGGDAACGNDKSDWYGRFSVSWDAGSSSSSRLRDWLDPMSTGAVTLDGIDQCPKPDVDFTAVPNPAEVGDLVSFTSSVSGGVPPYAYAWDVDADGTTDYTTTNASHAYGAAYNGNVVLTVTDSSPCAATVMHYQAVCPLGVDCTCTDNDVDGYGDPASAYCIFSALDCDDTDPHRNPGRNEDCYNGIDDDCDELVDADDPECTGGGEWSAATPAEASVRGPASLAGSSRTNGLALFLLPAAVIAGLRIRRRRG